MSVLVQLVMLAAGLALLVRGSRDLVEGASALALRVGVSPLLVGLTVVAFGTSSPELVTGVLGALRAAAGESGAAAVVVGNMLGSNTCNVGVILGLSALIAPIAVPDVLRRRDVPLLLVLTAALALAAWAIGLGRLSGFLLLALFVALTLGILASELRGRHVEHGEEAIVDEADRIAHAESPGKSAFRVVAGLVALAVGAWLLVEGAVHLARGLGVSEAVIGLTIVAIGTSLPELATSVAAARKGHAEIALGNVVGSNAFNIGAGLGLPALITPLHVSRELLTRDLGVMAAFTLVMAALCLRARIGRKAGAGLLVAYAAYVAWCIAHAEVPAP